LLIETEKKQSGNLKRKISTNRERFSELSNLPEKSKKKNSTSREIFFTFQHFGIEQQNGEI